MIFELKDEARNQMKMMKKNSKQDVEKAVNNLGKFASELEKSNKDFADILRDKNNEVISLEFDRSFTRGKKFVINLFEIMDLFREHHSREENIQFDEFMGNPMFMHIESVA